MTMLYKRYIIYIIIIIYIITIIYHVNIYIYILYIYYIYIIYIYIYIYIYHIYNLIFFDDNKKDDEPLVLEVACPWTSQIL